MPHVRSKPAAEAPATVTVRSPSQVGTTIGTHAVPSVALILACVLPVPSPLLAEKMLLMNASFGTEAVAVPPLIAAQVAGSCPL